MNLSKTTTYQAGVIQAAANRRLQKVSDSLLEQFGLTKMQWVIIGTVLDAGSEGMRLSELSQQLGTTMSYLTNAVNQLESRGILARKDNDKDTRSKLITVQHDYVHTCKEIEKTLRDGLRKSIYAKVSSNDFAVYMKVMSQLGSIDAERTAD